MENADLNQNKRYLFLNAVASGSHPPERLSAKIGEYYYFCSQNRLFSIAVSDLASPDAGLDHAREVSIPDGRVRGMVAFKEWLSVAVQKPGDAHTTLFCGLAGEFQWQPSLKFIGEPTQYCRGPRGKSVFFAANPNSKDQAAPKVVYWSDDGWNWQVFDYIHATEAEHLHSMTCHDGYLILLVGDQHFRHLKIKAFDDQGHVLIDAMKKLRSYQGLSEHSLYHALPGPSGQLLFALDGPTILVDQNGQVVFRDQQPMASGFQVAAHACFGSRPQVLLFGTWRRDPQHPFPCLYVFTHQCIYKYVNQSRIFDESLSWTGYQNNDATLYNLGGLGDHGFWPCFGGESLFMSLLDFAHAQELIMKKNNWIRLFEQTSGQFLLDLPAIIALD